MSGKLNGATTLSWAFSPCKSFIDRPENPQASSFVIIHPSMDLHGTCRRLPVPGDWVCLSEYPDLLLDIYFHGHRQRHGVTVRVLSGMTRDEQSRKGLQPAIEWGVWGLRYNGCNGLVWGRADVTPCSLKGSIDSPTVAVADHNNYIKRVGY